MAMGQRTRILIVDDSAVMRSLLRSVVSANANFEVAGTAADGATALGILDTMRPDLVLLDVEMPVIDGLATLRRLRAKGHTMPVIMCSSLTQRGAQVTIEALASGASDYVAKPSGQPGREVAMQAIAQELIPKIHALTTQSQPLPMVAPGGSRMPPSVLFSPATVVQPPRLQGKLADASVLAIGVSTGGPAALDLLLPALPGSFPLPVLIVQHMPELFTKLFAERLNGRCQLPVHEAVDGEPVRASQIYIARGNWHMEVQVARGNAKHCIRLTQGPPENHCRPAVDVMFRSAAACWGSGVLAVVLTGMGSDGMLGSRIVRSQGGSVLAQDQLSSAVWGMPGAVVQAGLAHKVLPLEAMALEIVRLAGRKHVESTELRESAV